MYNYLPAHQFIPMMWRLVVKLANDSWIATNKFLRDDWYSRMHKHDFIQTELRNGENNNPPRLWSPVYANKCINLAQQ